MLVSWECPHWAGSREGFAAGGAQLVRGRDAGAGGEVLGEVGGAAVFGDLPDLEGVAKSASSEVTGSAVHSVKLISPPPHRASCPPRRFLRPGPVRDLDRTGLARSPSWTAIGTESDDGQLRAIKWNAPDQIWEYAPAIVSAYLYDPEYQERTQSIDRQTAERVSRESLSSELPGEETLAEMGDEGQRMGWDFRPAA
jgi:hypothetical protein